MSSTDLMGLGMPPDLALALSDVANTLTCTGTTQATAAAVKSKITELSAASSQTGARLPATAKVGEVYYFFCSSSTTAVVYCPVGDNMNSSANGSANVAQNKGLIAWMYKQDNWATILTA